MVPCNTPLFSSHSELPSPVSLLFLIVADGTFAERGPDGVAGCRYLYKAISPKLNVKFKVQFPFAHAHNRSGPGRGLEMSRENRENMNPSKITARTVYSVYVFVST